MDDVPILKMSHWHVGPVGPGTNGGFIRPPDLDIAALQGAIVTTSEIPGTENREIQVHKSAWWLFGYRLVCVISTCVYGVYI